MAAKRLTDQMDAAKLLAEFRTAQHDVGSVNRVEQPLELHISGTTAYIPSYTRRVMDQNHGRPIGAIQSKTSPGTNRIFLQPTDASKAAGARNVRSDPTMGPAYFAFGVPLRKLGLRIPRGRRVILPLNPLETPDEGVVYWASFGDIATERRDVQPGARIPSRRTAPGA